MNAPESRSSIGSLDDDDPPPVGSLDDDHPLSARARAYGEWVVRGDRWPLSGVDLAAITWGTSTRAKRRHGRCRYGDDAQATITLSAHTAERAGFEGCREIIRHELVHAWQHHHRGRRGVETDRGVALVDDAVTSFASAVDDSAISLASAVDDAATDVSSTIDTTTTSFAVETGHGDSFRAWVEPLELSGRCSTPYERAQEDFAYVYGCPACGAWWGRHRLCPSVRQAAHGTAGSTGGRYCVDCDVLVQLRVGPWYLTHDTYDDDAIRRFVADDSHLDDSPFTIVAERNVVPQERPR